MATDSAELAQIAAEAQDIAKNVGQPAGTAHLLLAIFTVPGAADVLLRERGCSEDQVLAELDAQGEAPAEPPDSFALALDRSRQLADDCGGDPEAQAVTPRAAVAMRVPQYAPKPSAAPGSRVATLPPAEAPSNPQPHPEAQPKPQPENPSPALAPAPALDPSPGSLDPRAYPWLTTHTRNLTALAATGRLDPAIGRERELDELLDILGKRRANNPVLVGEPGVGKTAIVEGLAQRMLEDPGAGSTREGGSPQIDRILVELDVSGLVAGTQLRGSFSERLLGIKDEVKRAQGRVVVFIDELHMLIGAGAAGEGPQDAANELKAALSRGEFPCVGATTHDEFRKYIQGDPALERRFVPVLVREPSPQRAREILQGAASHYEEHHQVHFQPDALDAAARLTARYVRDRCLPDKAFAAIDLAGSRAHREGRTEVTREDVARAVARMAGLPEERLLQPDGERFLQLEKRLGARIVGHEQNLAAIAKGIRRNYAGFSAQRPLASFLFCGPSGVGKTETAKAIADEVFDGSMVRIDLSEYAEPHTAARLVGAPPGYVGYGEGGQLTEAGRRKPASVVLLDEVEKAHPTVLQLLLQVLDEGQLTDGRGRRIDFTAAVLVLTSNLGAAAFDGSGPRAMGFGASPSASSDPSLEKTLPPGPPEHPQAKKALELARAAFPPELWARLDERLVFAPLLRDEVARIAQLLLEGSSRRLWEERRIAFRTGPGLVDHLIARGGYQSALGARPMRQIIQRLVESPLADAILAGHVQPGETLLACAGDSGVEFRRDA